MNLNPDSIQLIMPIELTISLTLFRIIFEIFSDIWYFILMLFRCDNKRSCQNELSKEEEENVEEEEEEENVEEEEEEENVEEENATVNIKIDTRVFHNDMWQTPVITEKNMKDLLLGIDEISINIKEEEDKDVELTYIAFPWATYMDIISQKVKEDSEEAMTQTLKDIIDEPISENEIRVTVCQHIYFKDMTDLFKRMNISYVFTPHAKKDEYEINGVKIISIPLYPINAPLPQPKEYLYSFIGTYDEEVYMSDIRLKIFDLSVRDSDNNILIERTGEWHFQKNVYQEQMRSCTLSNDEVNALDKQKERYLDILSKSRYSLCPSGSGPNSIRLWESLRAGAIPIILSDSLRLPLEDKFPELWEKSVLRISEKNVFSIPDILNGISEDEEDNLRKSGIFLFEQLCGENGKNMHVTLLKELENIYSS